MFVVCYHAIISTVVLTRIIDIASLFHTQVMYSVSLLASIYPSPQK